MCYLLVINFAEKIWPVGNIFSATFTSPILPGQSKHGTFYSDIKKISNFASKTCSVHHLLTHNKVISFATNGLAYGSTPIS